MFLATTTAVGRRSWRHENREPYSRQSFLHCNRPSCRCPLYVFGRPSRLKATIMWSSKSSQSPSVGSNELVFMVAVVLVCDESDVRRIRSVPKRIRKPIGRCGGSSTGWTRSILLVLFSKSCGSCSLTQYVIYWWYPNQSSWSYSLNKRKRILGRDEWRSLWFFFARWDRWSRLGLSWLLAD
jgi:hypothetical protein